MKGVPDLITEYHNEPIEAGEKKENDDKPVSHDLITGLNLSIMNKKKHMERSTNLFVMLL